MSVAGVGFDLTGDGRPSNLDDVAKDEYAEGHEASGGTSTCPQAPIEFGKGNARA